MITCQKCRALLEPGTAECPYCHTDQRHHAAPTETEDAERTTRFGLYVLGILVGVFALMLMLDPARGDPGAGRFRPSGVALAMFGAANHQLVYGCGQAWRLLTTSFLHVDLLHLALNSIALLYLIPLAAGAFGVHRTACVYFASGLCGATLSVAEGLGGVGASGALCGLIGACLAWGKRRGGMAGEAIMRQMISWAIFIAIFGVASTRWGFMPVDNLAHLGGFLAGMGLGWIAAGVRARGGAADRAWTFAARFAVVAALVVAAVFWAPFVLRIFERRDMELYRLDADSALAAVKEALAAGKTDGLRESFPDGPRGTEKVRDSVREALARARARDPGADAALEHASRTLASWSSSLRCSHVLGTG